MDRGSHNWKIMNSVPNHFLCERCMCRIYYPMRLRRKDPDVVVGMEVYTTPLLMLGSQWPLKSRPLQDCDGELALNHLEICAYVLES